MKNKLSFSRFFIIFILTSIPLIFLSSLLNVMSYQKMITETYVHANSVAPIGAIQRINYSLSFGKTIEKFYGLEELLDQTKNISNNILNVSVINSKNEIISQVGKTNVKIPENIYSEKYINNKSGIFCSTPINEKYSIVLLLSPDYVNKLTFNYAKSILIASTIILFIILFISFIAYKVLLKKSLTGGVSIKSFRTLLMASLIFTQVALGGYVLSNYTNEYRESLGQMAGIVSNVIDNDIEQVVKQGIPYKELTGVEEYLQNISKKVDEIVKISIDQLHSENSDKFISNKIQILNQEYYINVEYKINQELINKNIINLLIEALILITVTILISIEISLFISKKKNKNEKNLQNKELNLSGLRIFYFILFLALGLDSSFVSIVSYKLFSKLNAGSNFLLSLPTTTSAITTMIGLLICLFAVNKFGVQKLIIFGSILAAVGSFTSSMCNDLFKFSFARGILGLGMAALISSTKLCAIFESNAEARLKILSTAAIGRIAGFSCGIVIGGLLSERLSYSFVFVLEAVLVLASILFIGITNLKRNENKSDFSISKLTSIFKSVKIIVYISLIIVPIYIASAFVSYCVPLYGNEISLSQSLISGLMMLNFMLSAYTSNISSKLVIRWIGVQKATFLYIAFIISSIGLFVTFNSLTTAIISVILLGIADGFGLNVIFEEMYIIQPDIDKTTVTFIFLLASKAGEAIAPILISSNINHGVSSASSSLIYVIAGGTILYLLFLSLNKLKNKQRKIAS